jgi:predicted secreted protein
MLKQALLGLLIITASSAFADVQTIQIEPQQRFSVTLESNRVTGYHWELAKPIDSRYLVFIKKKYTKPEYKLSGKMGHEKWDFRSLAIGETLISMKYLQPWEQDAPPLRTQEFKVKIKSKDKPKAVQGTEVPADELSVLLQEKAQAVVQSLTANEYLDLSQNIHPQKGVRFSPYASKLSAQDLVFSKEEVARFITDKREYYWGKYESSGQHIKLSVADYLKTFVKDRNYAKAKQVKYFNITEKAKGLGKFYKGDIVVEFYLPGTGPKWNSLRLVFEKMDEQYFLVGVLHDGWTL